MKKCVSRCPPRVCVDRGGYTPPLELGGARGGLILLYHRAVCYAERDHGCLGKMGKWERRAESMSDDSARAGIRHVPGELRTASNGHRPPADGQPLLEDIAGAAIVRFLEKLRAGAAAVRDTGDTPENAGDAEAIHDMRVAVRRLRSALALLEAVPGTRVGRLRALRGDLGTLADALGAVRDLDIFRADAETYAEVYAREHPEDEATLVAFHDALERRRAKALRALGARLDRPRTARALAGPERVASGHLFRAHAWAEIPARDVAGSTLWRLYEDILRFERELPTPRLDALHQLRIACKRLRYALELFEDALGSGVAPLVKQLVQAQDHLGALQDRRMLLGRIEAFQAKHPDERGIAAYAAATRAERERLRHEFAPLWARLSGAKLRRGLASLVADM